MSVVRLACLLAVLAPLGASAQPVAPEMCTYDLCALRVEPAFSGPRLVAGAGGTPAGQLGPFGSALSRAVASNERALEQARIYEQTRVPAFLAALGASLLVVAATAAAPDPLGDDSAALQTGALVGGVALGVVGVRLGLRSQRAASRAVWEYNRDLPR